MSGNTDKVIKSVATKPLLIHARDRDGNTPLHHACVCGHDTITRHLLEHGADVDAVNNFGCTPLHKAALGGHMACVELLVENCANVLRKNQRGQYAADLAGWRMHTAVTRYLRDLGHRNKRGRAHTTLDLAAIMKIQTDEEGNTRLHYAASCNKVNAVLAIVQQDNAVVHANNRAGHTALHLAAIEGHYDIVTALVNAGANPCQLTPEGVAASDLSSCHVRVRNQLLRLEKSFIFDLDPKNEDGDSPLHVACRLGRLSLVKECLKGLRTSSLPTNKVSHDCPNIQSPFRLLKAGETPLQVASQYQRGEVLVFLLSQFPDYPIPSKS
ncbi:hypothetical protein LEN26_004002 [Aphanomyces euteiches]|nr:hypothetical protein LEN26_004002 [Aphanomyces euteiches]